MPLTPADVHNVTFKKPMLGKRGYDEDEVDGFLDEVERELARLSDENGELRAQIESLRAGAPPGAADHAEMAAALDRVQREKHAMEQQLQELEGELHETHQQMVAAQQQIQQLQAQPPQQRAPQQGAPEAAAGGEQEALRLLMVAQRTADEHLEDSRREADNLVSEAHRESKSMVTEAQHESKTMVTDAQREAETMVTEARTQAEDLVGQARDKAERLEIETEQERQKVMGALEEKRGSLLKHIEELKTFEREYRTRLKLYLESQLRDLNGRQGAEDEEPFEAAPAENAVENERTGGNGTGARGGGFAGLQTARS